MLGLMNPFAELLAGEVLMLIPLKEKHRLDLIRYFILEENVPRLPLNTGILKKIRQWKLGLIDYSSKNVFKKLPFGVLRLHPGSL